jgi:hypothetical protein
MQTCTVTNGTGTIASVNVTNITIVCTTDFYLIAAEPIDTTHVLLYFSLPPNITQAENISNYSIVPALSVYSAVVNENYVALNIAPQTTNTEYTISVSGVLSSSGAVLTNNIATFFGW